MKLENNKFPINIRNIGNTVSSSIPLVLQTFIDNDNDNDKIILSGFGVGLSWASMIIEK